jgi:hypothetical protein
MRGVCVEALELQNPNTNIIKLINNINKTHFLISEYVNEKNFRYCCQENNSEMQWSPIRFATITG